MATECYSQLGFGFQPKLVVDFAGGTLTTDAGLVLVHEFDEQLGLSADVVSRMMDTETRATSRTMWTRSSVNGCIRSQPDTKTPTTPIGSARSDAPVGRGHGRTTLGSQPTLSQLENAIDWSAIQRLARTGVDWFCADPYGPTSIRPISSSISTAPMIRPRDAATRAVSWLVRPAHVPPAGLVRRPHGTPVADAAASRAGCECDRASSTSCGTSCPLRRGFRARRFFCAGTRGWPHRPSKPSSKPNASITCWASARIASSRPAWRQW